HPNAPIGLAEKNPGSRPVATDQGVAARMPLAVFPQPLDRTVNGINTATALVRLSAGGESLGTWLVSNIMDENFPPQQFSHGRRTYDIATRFTRGYVPYLIELLEFRHGRYPGTDIPRNFSSQVRIINPQTGEDRNALIYMNHPLRYQ